MTLEPLHPTQLRRFREMIIAEKWSVTHGLWKMARDARVQALRRMHPDISDQECCKVPAREMALREPDRLSLFVHPLEKAGMRYMGAGSGGGMHYRELRLTLVVDIPSQITRKQIPSLLAISKSLLKFSL